MASKAADEILSGSATWPALGRPLVLPETEAETHTQWKYLGRFTWSCLGLPSTLRWRFLQLLWQRQLPLLIRIRSWIMHSGAWCGAESAPTAEPRAPYMVWPIRSLVIILILRERGLTLHGNAPSGLATCARWVRWGPLVLRFLFQSASCTYIYSTLFYPLIKKTRHKNWINHLLKFDKWSSPQTSTSTWPRNAAVIGVQRLRRLSHIFY